MEECVVSFLALSMFARFSTCEKRGGVEDTKALFEEWAQYDEEEEYDTTYGGYELVNGEWVHPVKGTYETRRAKLRQVQPFR